MMVILHVCRPWKETAAATCNPACLKQKVDHFELTTMTKFKRYADGYLQLHNDTDNTAKTFNHTCDGGHLRLLRPPPRNTKLSCMHSSLVTLM